MPQPQFAPWLHDPKMVAGLIGQLSTGARRVLVTGGSPSASQTPVKNADIYDPATNRFSRTGDMIAARLSHASESVVLASRLALLPAQTLVVGGLSVIDAQHTNYVPSAEIFSEGSFQLRVHRRVATAAPAPHRDGAGRWPGADHRWRGRRSERRRGAG
jgi:hypothetical protein